MVESQPCTSVTLVKTPFVCRIEFMVLRVHTPPNFSAPKIYDNRDQCPPLGSYPRYMRKVNAHYERIGPRKGVRNSVPRFGPFGMHFHYATL